MAIFVQVVHLHLKFVQLAFLQVASAHVLQAIARRVNKVSTVQTQRQVCNVLQELTALSNR